MNKLIKKKQNNMDIKTEIMSNLEDVEYIIKRYDEMKEFYKKENIEMDSLEFYKGKRQALTDILIDVLEESQKENNGCMK